MIALFSFVCVCVHSRVEIIRLSDKSFKETIKDVELSSYRSTTKEGYISLDPSKPLPHEFEEGKLGRYNDINIRQKYVTATNIAGTDQKTGKMDSNLNKSINEHESTFISQYQHLNHTVFSNKMEFREMLMNAMNNSEITSNDIEKSTTITHFEKSSRINAKMSDINSNYADADDDTNRLNDIKNTEIKTSFESMIPSTDEVIYLNQTIEKISHTSSSSDAQKKTNLMSLDAPEVDKLLNEGKCIPLIPHKFL